MRESPETQAAATTALVPSRAAVTYLAVVLLEEAERCGVMVKVGESYCRRRSWPQRLLRRRCGVGDEGGGRRLQGGNGVGAQVRKMDEIVLCLKVADSLAGMLLLSSLVKGC